jgi:cysteine desulfurase
VIYLDNNATTPPAPEVLEAMSAVLDRVYGNPSSSHAAGREAHKAVEAARDSVAALVVASASEIVFTSGGTESDNWAIRGALAANPGKNHIVTTRVEHDAVRKLCEMLQTDGYRVSWIDVDDQGTLDIDQLRDSLCEDTAVVSVMLANNETGILFPIDEIAEIVKGRSSALMHVDGVNAVGKIPIDLRRSCIDLFSLSAHKFHGPKGTGALFIRDGVQLPALAIGGGQESGRRAGTEAVHQIAGLGAAADLVRDMTPMQDVRDLRDRLESGILGSIAYSSLNGTPDADRRLPNTSSISFENINGEAILARLDEAGICASTGSACNAADHRPSQVFQAMNLPYSKAMGSIRFSLGRYNKDQEIDTTLETLTETLSELRGLAVH